MSSRLATAVTTGVRIVLNLATFAVVFVAGWLISPIASIMAFIVAGMIVAMWTRTLPGVVASAALVSAGATLVLAWAQLAADNAPLHTPIADTMPFLMSWPGPVFLTLGVALGAALGAAGWMAGQPLATRLRRRRHQGVE